MKDLLKFAPNALIIAILAGLMQLLNDSSTFGAEGSEVQYFYGWIGFAAWACYFLAGCTPKGGLKVIGCWVAGVIAAILIILLIPTMGAPVAVGFIAFFVILFEKVPALDMIPAWFIGAACYFGLYDGVCHGKTSTVVLICCVVGQVFGYVTVLLRGKYEKMIATEEV